MKVLGFSTFEAQDTPDQIANLNNPSNFFGKAVSFTQVNPGSWRQVSITSAGDVKLGTSTVSGDFTVTSVSGNVYQAKENTLTIGGNLNLSANDAELNALQNLTLGTVNLTGDLTLKVVGGDIKQSITDTVQISGKTDLEATNIELKNIDNVFGDKVSVKTGTLKLTADGPLKMDKVQVTGTADLKSTGVLNLGTGTYGGKLKVNSGNADILQSGPIKFGGDTDFDAGSAKIDLFNPTNIWMGVLTFKAGTAMINHPQLMNAVSAGTLIVRVETTLAAPAASKASVSSTNIKVSEGMGNKAAVEVAVERTAAAGQTGLITVAVSAEAAAPGRSFSFALETPAVTGTPAAAAAEVKVTQMDGRALPEWLKFDNSTKTFVATNVPAGALPLQLKVGVGSTESVMVIKENQ